DNDYGYKKFYSSIDTILTGRKTYEQALGFGEWPYPGKKCYVLSRKPDNKADKNVEFAANATALANELKRQSGKGIWLVGGSEIITALLNAGLVDEFVVSIHPIILGSGIPLFAGIKKQQRLKLKDVKTFKTGLVQLMYDAAE
ncbi:MAG TPA: dihydrofolate reductase family protein, partial [Candidatus Nanoarchaeia archaeon]|nr:dihydrofolate reductase family protein [Candidatus Nanoarchaeia archaeon]